MGLSIMVFTWTSTSMAKDDAITIQPNYSYEGPVIGEYLLGFNNSYFNDLDEAWKKGNIPGKLKALGVDILRYPGGEETSRWNWKQTGVNGYVDIWSTNPKHLQSNWQSTYVPAEEWGSNESFMDIDEYFAHCRALGAEPLLGVNMTTGEVNDRYQDGLDLAVDMIEYCMKKNYPLTYVYFDNEPWHHDSSNYYRFPGQDYAKRCVAFSKALRKVNGKLKFVANPLDGNQSADRKKMSAFLKIAGDHVDIIDAHWYWNWGQSDYEIWKSHFPMRNSSKWKPYEKSITYAEFAKSIHKVFKSSGCDHLKLAALEWNIAPMKKSYHHAKTALMQAEMFMQMIEGEVFMACLWPMFYQITPPGSTSQFKGACGSRSIFEHSEPYKPTDSYRMFQIFKDISGGRLLDRFYDRGIYVLTVLSKDRSEIIYYIHSKHQQGDPISVSIHSPGLKIVSTLSLNESGSFGELTGIGLKKSVLRAKLPANSISRITLSVAKNWDVR